MRRFATPPHPVSYRWDSRPPGIPLSAWPGRQPGIHSSFHMAVNWPKSSRVARRTRYFDELTPPSLESHGRNSKSKSCEWPGRCILPGPPPAKPRNLKPGASPIPGRQCPEPTGAMALGLRTFPMWDSMELRASPDFGSGATPVVPAKMRPLWTITLELTTLAQAEAGGLAISGKSSPPAAVGAATTCKAAASR